MSTVPASGYLSDSARTEAEMKVALESVRDVLSEIGSKPPLTLTIGTGALTAPLSSMILVDAEGTGSDDILLTMETSGVDQGRVVILRNASSSSSEATDSGKITITSGTGAKAIELSGGGSLELCADRMLGVIYSGTRWIEVWRSYGKKNSEDSAAARTHFGLGSAAVETVATSSSASGSKVLKTSAAAIAANSILKVNSSGNIVAASISELGGGNADTVDNKHASDFVSATDTGAQAMAASLTATTAGSTRFTANSTGTGQTTGLSLQTGGIERALLSMFQVNGIVELKTKDASGTQTPSVRLNPANARMEFNTGTSSWESLRPGSGNGLDADKLDGLDLTQLLETTGQQTGGYLGYNMGGYLIVKNSVAGANDILICWGGVFSQSNSVSTFTFYHSFASNPYVLSDSSLSLTQLSTTSAGFDQLTMGQTIAYFIAIGTPS